MRKPNLDLTIAFDAQLKEIALENGISVEDWETLHCLTHAAGFLYQAAEALSQGADLGEQDPSLWMHFAKVKIQEALGEEITPLPESLQEALRQDAGRQRQALQPV